MVFRGKSVVNISDIENKMDELRRLLEQKDPKLSKEDIEEMVMFLINQNFL